MFNFEFLLRLLMPCIFKTDFRCVLNGLIMNKYFSLENGFDVTNILLGELRIIYVLFNLIVESGSRVLQTSPSKQCLSHRDM